MDASTSHAIEVPVTEAGGAVGADVRSVSDAAPTVFLARLVRQPGSWVAVIEGLASAPVHALRLRELDRAVRTLAATHASPRLAEIDYLECRLTAAECEELDSGVAGAA